MKIILTIPGRAPASTSPNSRKHWHVKHADGKEYGELVLLIALSNKPDKHEAWTRAHLTLTQYAVRLRDHDNFATSFKPGLDALVRAGLVTDDRPSVMDLSLRAVKVKHEHQECVVVELEKL